MDGRTYIFLAAITRQPGHLVGLSRDSTGRQETKLQSQADVALAHWYVAVEV